MAKCDYCGKEIAFGIKVSHSHRRSNRTWKPNIMKVKAMVNGSPKRVNVCSRCLRSGKVERVIREPKVKVQPETQAPENEAVEILETAAEVPAEVEAAEVVDAVEETAEAAAEE